MLSKTLNCSSYSVLAINIGETTRQHLHELSVEERQEFFHTIRTIYFSITEELLRTLPLTNDLLRHLQCLHPSMRDSETGYISIMNIARSLPYIIHPADICLLYTSPSPRDRG